MKEQHCSRKTAIVTAILIASITFGLCLTFILTVSKFDECHFDIECSVIKGSIDLSK